MIFRTARFAVSMGLATPLGLAITPLGCGSSNEAARAPEAADRGMVAPSRGRPIETDPTLAERVGRAYLEEVGYDEIIRLALEKKWIEHRRPNAGNALAQAAEAAGFMAVFTRYAVAAGVASQVDSPAPGPGDVAAVGILVIGLVDAGLLGGSLLASITKSDPITGPTAAAPVPGVVAAATAAPTTTVRPMPTTLPAADQDKEKEERCNEERDKARKKCIELLYESRDPPRGLTGGHRDLIKCMQGFISQDCGGNKIDEGPQGRRRRK